jgi:hypothetical protein
MKTSHGRQPTLCLWDREAPEGTPINRPQLPAVMQGKLFTFYWAGGRIAVLHLDNGAAEDQRIEARLKP